MKARFAANAIATNDRATSYGINSLACKFEFSAHAVDSIQLLITSFLGNLDRQVFFRDTFLGEWDEIRQGVKAGVWRLTSVRL
jgi:hypothetical protein